jgi:Protein of unknown function (DUF1573)
MRTFLAIILVLTFGLNACKNSQSADDQKITTDIVNNPVTASGDYSTDELPKMEFEKRIHDFGIIIQGEKVAYTFIYTNTGGSDLIIKSAKGSCGCTVPTYSEKPLKPGESSEIEVVFNSSGRKGNQHKTITLYTNSQPNKEVLTITGQIVVPN